MSLWKYIATTAAALVAYTNIVVAADVSVDASHSKIRLVSENSSVKPGQQFWFAARFVPLDHWHTYWKNPGDSGAAPILEWKSEDGLTFGDPLFPVPERMPVGPLLNYGYEKPSVLLIPVDMPSDIAEGNVSIVLDVEWLVCKVECIPQFGTIEFDLNIGESQIDPSTRELFTMARASLPDPEFWSASIELNNTESKLTVYMDQSEVELVKDAYFFPLDEGVTEYAAEQKIETGSDGLVITMQRYPDAPDLKTGQGVLVLEQKAGDPLSVQINAEFEVAISEFQPGTSTPANILPLWQAAFFALVGGLILNLMPCVFPVLSLKAFSFLSAGGQTAKQRQIEGWAYTGGILVSFGVIVGALVSLRAGGAAIGWGFQLQEPLFVATMILIMVVVGLSLSGFFNIQTGLEGSGQTLTQKEGPQGAFFTGVLATLVATPCTAPFMAPAIGYALTQPAYVIAVVFFMLGFGLALPFLILSYSPAIARRLPRPGPWMEKMKQGLAFAMYATAIWLVSVFIAQTDMFAVIYLLGGLVGLAFAIWLYQQGTGLMLRGIALVIGLSVLIFSAGLIDGSDGPASKSSSEMAYFNEMEDFSPAKLDELRSAGKPVFAYFSADWCITCKVNERVALFRDETRDLFNNKGITVVKGDWTNRNEEIANVLAKYGRAGVPLYLYYPEGSSDAVVLPEVLTTGIIKDAVS